MTLLLSFAYRKKIAMKLKNWFGSRRSTLRGKALLHYSRGMASANANSPIAAIADYTDAIELRDAPADIVAMSLFNRSLAFVAAGEFTKGVDDLVKVLEMSDAPESVKHRARHKLAKRQSHLRRIAFTRTA